MDGLCTLPTRRVISWSFGGTHDNLTGNVGDRGEEMRSQQTINFLKISWSSIGIYFLMFL